MSRETFAAQRRGVLTRGDAAIAPAVDEALGNWGQDRWWEPITAAAGDYFDEVASTEGATPAQVAGGRDDFLESLGERLKETTQPSGDSTAQATRLTQWVSTASVNAGTAAAALADDQSTTLEWVTMHDDSVRSQHRAVDGQTVPAGGTFSVAGFDLHYPGEPVGPPEIWINCRCLVRPSGGDMTAALTAATEVDDEVDPDAPEITDDDLTLDVPFYGVAAPEGVPTGDRRKFAVGAMRNRDLPLNLRRQPSDVGGHDGAITIGRIDSIWRDEASNLVKYQGVFHQSPEAEEYLDLLANGMERGVSVDLDDTTVEMQNEDGSAFDMEAWQFGDPEPLAVVTDGRIAAITVVGIPAFQEAFISIGTWDDHDQMAQEAPAYDCEDCEVAALVARVPAEHRAFFTETFGDFGETGVTYTMQDGYVYVFDEEGMHAFTPGVGATYAPGTHDGPGWVTHPRATERIRAYWVHGKGAAKIRWGVPGDFNRCRRQLAKYVQNPKWLAGLCANMHKEAIKVWPGQEVKHALDGEAAPAFSLVASADSVYPHEWFEDPALSGPTPIAIDGDHIFGHVAKWGVCHIGISGICTEPPNSHSNYAHFLLHSVTTDAGEVAVGTITMDTGHAGKKLRGTAATAHYDNTGTLAAKVAAGEDKHGIWINGVVRPGLSEDQRFALSGATLSGDWREFKRGELELVAALAVNVPGFEIPRTSLGISGADQVSLVASGVIARPVPVEVDAYAIADRVTEILAERVQRAAAAAVVRAEARRAARQALAQ